ARFEQRRAPVNTSRKGTALVVDDESDVRRVIGDAIADAGCRVLTAEDAETALSILDEGGIDVAFVDINLGRASGFDILDSVRKRGGTTDIVVITGKASVANAIEATRRGAYDYVTKPFDVDHLISLAQRILDSRAAVRAQ